MKIEGGKSTDEMLWDKRDTFEKLELISKLFHSTNARLLVAIEALRKISEITKDEDVHEIVIEAITTCAEMGEKDQHKHLEERAKSRF